MKARVPIRSARFVAVICCASLALFATPTGRAELPEVGVNPGAPIWSGSILFSDALAADIAGSGCRFVRINFRIDGLTTWTPEHLAKYDTIVANARNHNLQILGLICYEAVHASQAEWNENYNTTGMNPFITEFANTAYMLMDRYKDDIKVFELWNEPDCWSVPPAQNPLNAGCFYIWPRIYANLLAETYTTCIAQGGSGFFSTNGISLSTAGLFAHDISGSFSTSRSYFTDVYNQTDVWNAFQSSPHNPTGRRYPWDYFGYHFYLNQGTAVSTVELTNYFNDIRTMKSFYNDSTPFLLTEFGWNTQSVSEALQAQNLTDSYNWLRAQSDVASSFWYQWNNGGYDWGLVYSIGNPKPSYFAFAAQCGTNPIGADFFGWPVSGPAPLEVAFTDQSFGTIDTYAWNFGDGGTSDQVSPTHTYTTPGTYSVSLTVTGPGGTDTETKTDYVVVGNPILHADLDADGDGDLADLALFSRCYTGGAAIIPPGCECAPSQVDVATDWESGSGLGTLSRTIDAGDVIAGQVATLESGGFYDGVPGGTQGGLADLTDGAAGTGLEAVLADYLRPSLQVRYTLDPPQDLGALYVFAENTDGRVFQHYDVSYSNNGGASYQPLVTTVTTGPFGQVNTGSIGATLTAVEGVAPGAIALGVDRLRFTFYDVSSVSPGGVFWDAWDDTEPEDTDGEPRAYVGSLIKEIDVVAAEAGNMADLDGDGVGDATDLELFADTMSGPQ